MQSYERSVRLGEGWEADIQYAGAWRGKCVVLGFMAIRSPEGISVIRCPMDSAPSVVPCPLWPNALLADLEQRIEDWRRGPGQELCDEFWREQRRKNEEDVRSDDCTNEDSLDADFADEDPAADEA